MIAFKDFSQKIIELPGWFTNGSIESVTDTIQRMNYWIEEKNPDILNIETIQALLNSENYSIKPMGKITSTSGSFTVYHGTIFRVWYND